MWGMSFPIIKAIRSDFYCAPASEFTQSAAFVFLRFFLSFVLFSLWFWLWIKPGKVQRDEWIVGTLMGVLGGFGLLFQGDGLAYTTPGTSAFLTQMTCILVPVISLLQGKRKFSTLFSTALGLGFIGIYLISGFDLRTFSLGRGEAETLISASFFSLQILTLEAKRWQKALNLRSTWVMFFFFAVVNLPFFNLKHLCVGGMGASNPWMLLSFMAVLVTTCSLLPYILMNIWQPKITGTEATFIYSLEAIFTIFFNFLWIPLLFKFGGYNLELEIPSLKFSLGALLLIVANFFLFAESYRSAKKALWKT